MTKREYMLNKYKEFYEGYTARKMEFYRHPSIARMDPFKIADGLYYVGDKKVCIHLIDTGDGLILLDSGYLGASHLLVDSIWRAGFDPRDIKIILHTHGHTDHYGASGEFARMYGCKLAISRIDAELVKRQSVNGSVGGALRPLEMAPEFDMILEDGDVIELGAVKIRCILTHGHTEGVLSFFFKVTYLGEEYTAGLFGGAGVNALTLPYLYKNGYPEDMPEVMLKSIERLRAMEVDIHLGNHPSNNRTLEKRTKQENEGGNPFIDKTSWSDFLAGLEKKVKRIIEDNRKLGEEADKVCDN
jgi:metallo-beta-lactamase class B